MKFLPKKYQHLEKTFKKTYVQRENVEVSDRWRLDVMRTVRHLGPLHVKPNPLLFVERFVWRFATVACMIALVLSMYVGLTGFNPADTVAELLLDNPVEFTLAQVLGEE
jgi:hypothetical protein